MLVVLVMGLPAAGKTTFIQQLTSLPSLVLHHISIDDLYNQQQLQHHQQQQQQHDASSTVPDPPTPPFSPTLWHAARDAAYSHTLHLLQTHTLPPSIQHVPPVCTVLCVDDVFHLRSMRQSYYRLCRSFQQPFYQLLVDTPLAICLANLTARSASADRSAAHSQLTAEYVTAVSERFDWPNEAEWRYTTTVAMRGGSSKLDCSFLRTSFVPPPPTRAVDEPTMAHVQSAVHELDIALRRAMAQHMAEWAAQRRQPQSAVSGHNHTAAVSYARAVNELRKRVLTDARQPSTAVYEMMYAPDEQVTEHVDEQRRMQAAVQRAVLYFNSLIDSAAPGCAHTYTT